MESLWLHSAIVVYHSVVTIILCIHTYQVVLQDERMWTIIYMAGSFLTIWNFVLQVSVFYGYLLYDIINALEWYPKLNRKFKIFMDYCFYGIIAPQSVFITILFWIIWHYDSSLIFGFSGLMYQMMPMWLSQILHTFVSITALVQTYHNKVYIKTQFLLLVCFAYSSLYFICIEVMHSLLNEWPYPLLKILSPMERYLLIAFIIVLAHLFLTLYNHLNKKYILRYTKAESLSTRKL